MTATPARAATGPYGGTANGDLVHVQAVKIAGALEPGLADAHVAPSTAQVQSNGLPAGPYAGKRSAARATNADASLLGGAIPLSAIVEAEQTAPPTAAASDVQSLTGPVDLAPLATLEAAKAEARAVWGSSDTTCVTPGSPIAKGTSTVLDADVLPVGDPIGSLLSVVNGEGGAVFTTSDVGLVNVAGQTTKGVKSTVLDQLTGVVLFKGTANEITLNVVAPPTLSAIATGTAGTSTVTYNQPVVEIIQGGSVTDVLNASDINTEIELPGVILRLSLGVLKNVVKTNTEASGTTRLLGIEVVDAADAGLLGLQVEIAPMTVKATVPAGGVECNDINPLNNLQVDASTGIVLPGGSFQYAITVPNIGSCTLNNVKVVLNVTGPSGTTITAAEPPPNTISGLTVTWPDIGSIAPGALKTLKATIKVPSGAKPGETFKGTATASGTCNGSGVSKTADSGPIPAVGSASSSSCDLSASSIVSSHKEVRVGDYFNEYVRVTNLGRGTCNGVKVTMPYPPDTSFVACTDSCTHDDAKRVVTWTIASLGSGVSKDLVATFKVEGTAKNGENLGTTVSITSGGKTVTDKTSLPVVTASNILNAGAQRSRGILPRTGASIPLGFAFSLVAVGLAIRALRRRGLTVS